jgi:hypothetical protein
MGKMIYEGDFVKRMSRAQVLALERLAGSGKTGIFEVAYGEKKIKIQIKKKGNDTVVSRFFAI